LNLHSFICSTQIFPLSFITQFLHDIDYINSLVKNSTMSRFWHELKLLMLIQFMSLVWWTIDYLKWQNWAVYLNELLWSGAYLKELAEVHFGATSKKFRTPLEAPLKINWGPTSLESRLKNDFIGVRWSLGSWSPANFGLNLFSLTDNFSIKNPQWIKITIPVKDKVLNPIVHAIYPWL